MKSLFLLFCAGDLLASAADDGMLIIWTKDEKGQGSVWGRDTKDAALDKETWKVSNAIRYVCILADELLISDRTIASRAAKYTTWLGHLPRSIFSRVAPTIQPGYSP
jgi:hypothetical protein